MTVALSTTSFLLDGRPPADGVSLFLVNLAATSSAVRLDPSRPRLTSPAARRAR